MKLILAVIICKILRFIGKLVGKGSSLPGKYALKICPDVLGRVKLPERVIAVTGSNGKTSTVEMIAAILRADGKNVVYNEEGSNQIEGVTTLILCNSTLGGKMKADVLLLESDERYAKKSFQWFHPTHFVITNLYRDQLTRNGHPEWVYNAILPAIHPDTMLVLNADDPLVSCFAQGHEMVKWFGLDECSISTKEHHGIYHDGARCPVCCGLMEYDCYHYEHIGHYHCNDCGHHRHETDFAVTALDLEGGKLVIDGETEISLAFKSIYNVYNILAAWSVCALAGVDQAVMASVINNYILKNGRMVQFALGSHHGTLLTSKHENSVAYDTNLGYIAGTKAPCEVLIIVDAISRKYFTGETSWLWDIDFELLNREHVTKIVLCGKYVNDLAMRFDYTSIPKEKIACYDTVPQAADALKADGGGELFVVTCFSDRDKLLNLVEKKGGLMMELTIMHLYPDSMSLYGEYANVAVLKRHLEAMGVTVNVRNFTSEDTLDFDGADFIYMGAGTEKRQKSVLIAAPHYADALKAAVGNGAVVLFTGNAMETLGASVEDAKGKVWPGFGLAGFTTKESDWWREPQDVLASTSLWDSEVVGFMNKCSTTHGIISPLFDHLYLGFGNEESLEPEGYVDGNVFGTHLTGPVLVKNPDFLDLIITRLFQKKGWELPEKLPVLPHEREAYAVTLRELQMRSGYNFG